MLDSITSLALRRLPRMTIESFDTPMLEVSDIDLVDYLEETSTSICSLNKDWKYACATPPELVELFLQKARLCVLINHLLKLHYPSTARKANQKTNDTVALSLSLAEWAERLPSTCKYHLVAKQDLDTSSSITLQRFILHMIYYVMFISLQQFLSLSEPQALPQHRSISRRCVCECVRRVSKTTSNMYQNKLGHLLPGAGAFGLLHTLTRVIDDIVQVQDMESWAESEFGFQACIQALASLQDFHTDPEFPTASSEAAVGDLSSDYEDVKENSSLGSLEVTPEDLYHLLEEPMEEEKIETNSSSGQRDLILEDLLYLPPENCVQEERHTN